MGFVGFIVNHRRLCRFLIPLLAFGQLLPTRLYGTGNSIIKHNVFQNKTTAPKWHSEKVWSFLWHSDNLEELQIYFFSEIWKLRSEKKISFIKTNDWKNQDFKTISRLAQYGDSKRASYKNRGCETHITAKTRDCETGENWLKFCETTNDHGSKFFNLGNWKEEAWKIIRPFTERDSKTVDSAKYWGGARLYQLSYETTHWERGQFIGLYLPIGSEMM